MTDEQASPPGPPRRRRWRGGIAIGGGALVTLVLLSRLFGVNVAGFGTTPDPSPPAQPSVKAECATDDPALECELVDVFNSLDEYWEKQTEELGSTYAAPGMEVFTGNTQTQCGSASAAVGPFYCPLDEVLYLDTEFFTSMDSQLDAGQADLAQAYIVAHAWGHHVQNSSGIVDQVDRSGPEEEVLQLELQADCLAGAWMADTVDSADDPVLDSFDSGELTEVLREVADVGESRLEPQEGQPQPEVWVHGSMDQRERWVTEGMTSGPTCDTFAVDPEDL